MNRLLALVSLTLLVLAACGGGAPSGTAGPTGGPTGGATTTPVGDAVACAPGTTTGDASVAVVDFGYEPDDLSVNVGQTVAFANTGQAPHTVTFDEGPDCGRVDAGGTTGATFNAAGEYPYHCTIHRAMVATITVNQ